MSSVSSLAAHGGGVHGGGGGVHGGGGGGAASTFFATGVSLLPAATTSSVAHDHLPELAHGHHHHHVIVHADAPKHLLPVLRPYKLPILASASIQELHDFALIAHSVTGSYNPRPRRRQPPH